jgi:hypothetical protein
VKLVLVSSNLCRPVTSRLKVSGAVLLRTEDIAMRVTCLALQWDPIPQGQASKLRYPRSCSPQYQDMLQITTKSGVGNLFKPE